MRARRAPGEPPLGSRPYTRGSLTVGANGDLPTDAQVPGPPSTSGVETLTHFYLGYVRPLVVLVHLDFSPLVLHHMHYCTYCDGVYSFLIKQKCKCFEPLRITCAGGVELTPCGGCWSLLLSVFSCGISLDFHQGYAFIVLGGEGAVGIVNASV